MGIVTGPATPTTASAPPLAAGASDCAVVPYPTAEQVADLELVNDQRLAQSQARAVLFRQRFGDLSPALGSMVTVGVANGEIAYVSSSLVKAEFGNGDLVDWDAANIHILTHSLHYGMGVFEGIRAYETSAGPGIFRLTEH